MKEVEKWSLTYAIIRPFMQLAHRLIYKEFHVVGRNNIPKGLPVIFAPNHQNGLMDDMIIVTTAPGQTVFLGRADIFKNKMIAMFLKFIKIIPIYRIRDGKDSLQKNEATFHKTIEILKNKTNICLYPEGAQVGKRSMLVHKKAIPRIVFMAHEKSAEPLNIQIVPVGLTFSNYYKFRRNLVVQYGKPISTTEFCEQYDREGERNATVSLRQRIHDGISELVVNIPDAEISDVYESSFKMMRTDLLSKMKLKKNEKNILTVDRYFTNQLSEAFSNDPEKKEWVVKSQRLFDRKLQKMRLSQADISLKAFRFSDSVLTILIAVLTLPITLVGVLVNGWLFYLTHYPYRKKIKDLTFWSTISFGTGLIGFLIYDIILWIILSNIVHSILLAYFIVFAISIAGVIAWDVKEKIAGMLRGWQVNKLLKSKNVEAKRLLQLKTELQEFYRTLI